MLKNSWKATLPNLSERNYMVCARQQWKVMAYRFAITAPNREKAILRQFCIHVPTNQKFKVSRKMGNTGYLLVTQKRFRSVLNEMRIFFIKFLSFFHHGSTFYPALKLSEARVCIVNASNNIEGHWWKGNPNRPENWTWGTMNYPVLKKSIARMTPPH